MEKVVGSWNQVEGRPGVIIRDVTAKCLFCGCKYEENISILYCKAVTVRKGLNFKDCNWRRASKGLILRLI